jgi:glutaminyl-tRNA synthetase
MDPQNDNYNMFDLVAYRVKFAPHPHAGRGWCVYPSYDYTHCLVDSFEDVTHSLCTLEFEPRRASYYWLLQVAGLYKPVVWEYSRLSVTHNVLSKRKLAALVSSGAVSGWDDPRLLTLAGLRRRGITADAINAFCRECGITRAGDGEVSHRALDAAARADADARSPRALAVLAPLEVELTNLNADHLKTYRGRVWPNKPVEDNNETYELPLTRTVYIEATDYRVEDAKGYYGLAPGKSVMLRYAGVATAASHDVDPATGAVVKVYATFAELAGGKPPKGVLSWVGQPSPGVAPFAFEARLYGPLFKSPSPGALGDAWMADVDPASEAVASGAVGSAPLATAPVGSRFQLERLGYFIVDAPGALIRTVTLRETVATKGVRAAGGGA